MAATAADARPDLVTALYLRTKSLHAEAERSGIIREMLRGTATRGNYIVFLRNLLPAYREMENGLDRLSESPGLSELASFRLDRSSAIESDLDALSGRDWRDKISVLDAGRAYGERIAEAAKGDGLKLIAHAYTRYLGDLSGGLILQKLLDRSLGLRPSELSFYRFERFHDLGGLKRDYRNALTCAAAHAPDTAAIVEEGAAAFSLNIDLSWAVQKAGTTQATISATG
jgi:heme oxygenase